MVEDRSGKTGRRGTRLDLILATFAVVVFSFTYTLLKIALQQLPPTTVGSIRFLLCTAFVLPFALAKQRSKLFRGYSKTEWIEFISVGFVAVFVPQFLQNLGLVYTSAALAGVIQSTIPLFAGILAFFLLKEQTSRTRWLGAAVSLGGVVLLSGGGTLAGFQGSSAFGNLLQVGASLSSGGASILVKKLLATKKPEVAVTMSFLFGGLMLTGVALLLDRTSWPSNINSTTWTALLLVSGLYAAALFCWYWVLEHVSVARLYFTLFLLPVLGIIAPVVLLGETFPFLDVVFAAIIIVGLAVAESSGSETTKEMRVKAMRWLSGSVHGKHGGHT